MDNGSNVILVIDDNENDYLIIKRYLSSEYKVIYNDGQGELDDIFDVINTINPACIILDYNLGKLNGIDMLKDLNLKQENKVVSVIMLTNEKDPNVIVDSIRNNADNYLLKDNINKHELTFAVRRAIRETELKERILTQQNEILRMSKVDDMTGLLNRRYFIHKVENEILRLPRSHNIISLIVLDLDYFKSINDNYGHIIGDEVLRITANIISDSVRATDLVCRYGGDEFTICLVEALEQDVMTVIGNHIEILRRMIQIIATSIDSFLETLESKLKEKKDIDNQKNKVTASVGLAYHLDQKIDFYDLFKQADECLYLSKKSGGNSISIIDNESKKPVLVESDL